MDQWHKGSRCNAWNDEQCLPRKGCGCWANLVLEYFTRRMMSSKSWISLRSGSWCCYSYHDVFCGSLISISYHWIVRLSSVLRIQARWSWDPALAGEMSVLGLQ